MKKILLLILLLGISALFVSCKNSKEIDQEGADVFPSSAIVDSVSITMGDVMPFYDDGVMNIYHLRNTTGTNSLFYHPIARLTTTDFIHYKDEGIALNYEEEIHSVDAALGTGSFIKDEDGLYHCFYTGHNDSAHDEGLPFKEVIRHATSADQVTWVKDEDFLIYGYEDDFRDPYVYYDDIDNCYYMLITSRDFGQAVIRRYSATSLSAAASNWTFVDNFFTNDEGSYNMECPSFVKLGNFYYLAYSEQGDNRVTHYRYKDSHDGEWKKFERDAIDASGFYAGRLEKAGDKLYAFAWCARLTGGNTGSFDWAGNLVTHELVQKENGELAPVMPESYKDYFSHEVSYLNTEEKAQKEYSFDGEKFKASSFSALNTNVTRVNFQFSVSANSGDFGLTFGIDGAYDNRLGDGSITFDLTNNKIVCYNNISSIVRYGSPLTSINYQFEANKEYNVDVVISGEVISVYLNNEVALTARLISMVGNNFAFYSNKAKVEIKGVSYYE